MLECFQVDEGGRVTLTLRDISATDADTPIDQLAVFAEVLPSFGVLENTKKGETELSSNVHFADNSSMFYLGTIPD